MTTSDEPAEKPGRVGAAVRRRLKRRGEPLSRVTVRHRTRLGVLPDAVSPAAGLLPLFDALRRAWREVETRSEPS